MMDTKYSVLKKDREQGEPWKQQPYKVFLKHPLCSGGHMLDGRILHNEETAKSASTGMQ